MQPEQQQQQQQQFQTAGYQTASGFTLHPNMLVQQFIMQQQHQQNMNQATAVIHSSAGGSTQPIYLYQGGQSIYQQNLVPVQTVLAGSTGATIDLTRASILNASNPTSKTIQSSSNNQMPDKLNESNSSTEDQNASNLSGDRLYKCSQCFKTFRKKVHLNQHCRIHSGERPYGCDYCEKRFTQLSHLWQHTRRHTGERPYKCDVGTCDKSFTQLSNLQSHLRTHGINTSDTPNTVSNSSSNQQQIIQGLNPAAAVLAVAAAAANLTNSSGTVLKCSKCNKSFASRDELLAHMATRHGDLSMTLATTTSSNTTTSVKSSRGSGSSGGANKRHYCEICRKRFATEGVIRSHVCSRQPNAALVRNAEGSLIIKAFNPP